MSLERGRLKGLIPLEDGLTFAAQCLIEIIDQLEEAYLNEDAENLEDLCILFEKYTGRMSLINEKIDKIVTANLRIVGRRWSLEDRDVS